MAETRLNRGNFRYGQTLFGLHDGQMRIHKLCRNAGWYNQHGQRFGNGDLSLSDFETIALSLEEGELFVVLREQVSLMMDVAWPTPTLFDVIKESRFVIAPLSVTDASSVYESQSDYAPRDQTETILNDHSGTAPLTAKRFWDKDITRLFASQLALARV